MVKVEVSHQHTVDVLGEIEGSSCLLLLLATCGHVDKELEVREFLLTDHVQAAIEHNPLAPKLNYDAAAADILPGTKRNHLDSHF